jgi:hypothetical protein
MFSIKQHTQSRMCEKVLRGNTLQERLHDLKLLSLPDEGACATPLNKEHLLKPWTWFARTPKVSPESTNAPPALDTHISETESTISALNDTIADLQRQLLASSTRTSEQSQQLREASDRIRNLTFELAADSKVHSQQTNQIQQLTEELRTRGPPLLEEEGPKEEFKKFLNVIVLSPDHSYALNMKSDEPISQGGRDSQDEWTARYHYLQNEDSAYLKGYIYGKKLQHQETVQDLLTIFNVSTAHSDVLNSSWQKISPGAPIQTIIIRDK